MDNQERSPSAVEADVVAFLRRAASAVPSGVAVAHADGQLSYRELLRRALAVAEMLPAADEGPEAIAVVTEHDVATPELYFGVMARGHAVVPISARLPSEAINSIARAAGARIGLLAADAGHHLRPLSSGAEATRWIAYCSDWGVGPLPAARATLPARTAMVAFTSGTTGEPKGVIVTHENLVVSGLTAALVFGFGATNCQVNPLPLAHFSGASRVIFAAVRAGNHVILPEFDPRLVFEAIERWHGTHLTVAPSMAADLLTAGPEQFDLASLETLIYGTAPMPLPVANELLGRMQCDLINGYGLTESTGLATALDAEAHRRAARDDDQQLLSSVGSAVPGVELRILTSEFEDASVGETGEIALRGLKVSPGYLGNPENTAARFLPGGWLRTGDQARFDADHNVLLEGRLDDMIITGGLNVQPAEIERHGVLFPGVAECAAFAVSSNRWGQEVRLAVVPAPGAAIQPDDVKRFLRSRLDPYKVPKIVHIVDELPRSSVGKVQRRRLAERHDQ